MEAEKIQFKLFATPDSADAAPPEAFIAIFHRWIKERLLPELLIDVANYVHVPKGPGIVLIGHGCDYFMDQGEGRLGLLFSRKRSGPPPAERLLDAARRTFHAALLLERDAELGGKLRFASGELVFRINDRLRAPNTEETLAAVRPELEEFARRVFAAPFELVRLGGPQELFAVRVTSRATAPLATYLERVGGPPEPGVALPAAAH
jgi:hypothetical protein